MWYLPFFIAQYTLSSIHREAQNLNHNYEYRHIAFKPSEGVHCFGSGDGLKKRVLPISGEQDEIAVAIIYGKRVLHRQHEPKNAHTGPRCYACFPEGEHARNTEKHAPFRKRVLHRNTAFFQSGLSTTSLSRSSAVGAFCTANTSRRMCGCSACFPEETHTV